MTSQLTPEVRAGVNSHTDAHPNDLEALAREEFLATNTILGSVIGSRLQGIATETSDTDEMAIAVETPSSVFGGSVFESITSRPRADGERSQPGDVERTTYSLRKFLHLARKGNPHILQLFWAPTEFLFATSEIGDRLRDMRSSFVSLYAVSAHLGYAAGELATVRKGFSAIQTRRPELATTVGYDAKAAGHILRLCYQGRVLATEGYLPVPLPSPIRSRVMAFRRGEHPLDEAVAILENEIAELSATRERVRADRSLPENADSAAIVAFSTEAHLEWWTRQGLI